MHILYKLAFLFAFVANLFGCDHVHRSITEHIRSNGTDQLYSKVEITADSARFECLASQSGTCHYTLFAHACSHTGPCDASPIERFDVAAGAHLNMARLPKDVQPCVSQDAAPVTAHCKAATPSS